MSLQRPLRNVILREKISLVTACTLFGVHVVSEIKMPIIKGQILLSSAPYISYLHNGEKVLIHQMKINANYNVLPDLSVINITRKLDADLYWGLER